jgi:hypothetical protein
MSLKLTDPLAQSFYVSDPKGFFATSVDVYFYSKDSSLPVSVELRPMKLGIPLPEVYPFSRVTLEPGLVFTSPDATTRTKFKFSSPVYLEGEKFHALVLTANSKQYTVWVAKLGSEDVTYSNAETSQRIIVTSQPLTGSLFLSQNGQTWTPQQEMDLKFVLSRASFKNNAANINFYNPELKRGNNQIAILAKDALEISSKRVRFTLDQTITDTNLIIGNTIKQQSSDGQGNYVSNAGIATNNLTIVNSGIGYTPSLGGFTFFDVPLTTVSGTGKNATADITINGGVAIGATIVLGGSGYSVGDLLTADAIGTEVLGRNLRLSVSAISGINEIVVDQIQGTFRVGAAYTMQYVTSAGISTDINAATGGNVKIVSSTVENDGLNIKVNHLNHGMHAGENVVTLSKVSPDSPETELSTNYPAFGNVDIPISNLRVSSTTGVSLFATFENVGVSSTNPGFVLIGDEIVAYTGISGNNLTGVTRQVDGTNAYAYDVGTDIRKYELAGISLRRINKTHKLQDATVTNPIDLDYYHIRIDTNFDGLDRSASPESLPELHFNVRKSTGGSFIEATQNIQYEIVRPIVQTMILNGTDVNISLRALSGQSVGGSEVSFVDQGFEPIALNATTYLTSPRLLCSRVNELENAVGQDIEGDKSLCLTANLSTTDTRLSPVIDLERVALILTSNRINNPVTNYITDERTSTLKDDPHSFVYATKPISLETPSTSIKVIVSAYVNVASDLRAFYAIMSDAKDSIIYYPFPGYTNLDANGNVINLEDSDGSPDQKVEKTDIFGFASNELIFKDYEFTINKLPSFKNFGIKLVGNSTNQTYPIRLRDLRVIALA